MREEALKWLKACAQSVEKLPSVCFLIWDLMEMM
jgi:hypothetical protein